MYYSDELYHHGIKGQKWGNRRYQYEDGSLTPEGRQRYGVGNGRGRGMGGGSAAGAGGRRMARGTGSDSSSKSSKVKKILKTVGLVAAGAAITAGAGYAAYKNIPAFKNALDTGYGKVSELVNTVGTRYNQLKRDVGMAIGDWGKEHNFKNVSDVGDQMVISGAKGINSINADKFAKLTIDDGTGGTSAFQKWRKDHAEENAGLTTGEILEKYNNTEGKMRRERMEELVNTKASIGEKAAGKEAAKAAKAAKAARRAEERRKEREAIRIDEKYADIYRNGLPSNNKYATEYVRKYYSKNGR